MTVGQEVSRGCFTPKMSGCKILEAVRELEIVFMSDISNERTQVHT